MQKLSVIIPVFNERKTILKILEKIENVKLEGLRKEIIIVDDFSSDGTREVLRRLRKYRIFYHDKNYGKGRAVRTGLEHATGDIILIQDADLEYEPADYPKLLKPILDGETSVVYGSRFKFADGHFKRNNFITYKVHTIGNMALSAITNALFSSNLTDMESCYKVFTKEVKNRLRLKSDRFDIEPEITAKILKNGYTIIEVPINYHSRDFEEGKKITWKDGVKAFLCLAKYRFVD